MHLSLALLLLLYPVSSLQTPSGPKRNTTGASPGLTLSPAKTSTTALATKQKAQPAPPSKSSPSKANQTLSSTPAKSTQATVAKPVKEKTATPAPQPIKVVITDGCAQNEARESKSNSSSSTGQGQEKELTLKPGAPLVMTHRISLVPSTCTGGCEAEMAALKGRVEYLEKEMAVMKKICTSCSSGRCPNNCSNQGRCEEGKCVCNNGFSGTDCSVTCPSNCNKRGACVKGKCVCNPGFSGLDCSKGSEKKIKVTVETVTMKVTPESNAIKESTTSSGKKSKVDKTIFLKKADNKDQKRVVVGKKEDREKETEVSRVNAKVTVKTNTLKNITVSKVTTRTPAPVNVTKTGKTVKTIGQVFLKQSGRRPEQATKGKTEMKKIDTKIKVTSKQEAIVDKSKKLKLKDQPQVNVTQISVKKTNGTSKVLTELLKGSKPSVNVTTLETTTVKKVLKTTVTTQSTDGTVKTTSKTVKVKPSVTNATSTEEKKSIQANATIVLKEGPVVKKKAEDQTNLTTIETKTYTKQTNKTSQKPDSSVITLAVQNITSASVVLTWDVMNGMFRNFTLARREMPAGAEDKGEVTIEDTQKGKVAESQVVSLTSNGTEVNKQSANKTSPQIKAHVSTTTKTEVRSVRKFTQVLPGNARSFLFRNLRPQTHYALSLFGTAPGFRSKIYRVTVTTGPEPPSEVVFSNISETSVCVSWTKPKNTVAGFKIIYTNTATKESGSLSMDSLVSTVVISKLSPGSSYEISVTSMLEASESDAVLASVTTVPDAPKDLQVVNITDSKALLVWKPAQANIDRYILSYGSSKSPNVTVTVMLSGKTLSHQMRGLQRSTLYTIKLVSQINSLQSLAVSTAFSTTSGIRVQSVAPSTVTSRSAVISWKAPHVAFKTYKLTYQLPGQDATEVLLSPTVIQYELTGLQAQSNYSVRVEGEKEGSYITVVSTQFTTGASAYPRPSDCSQVQLNGVQASGEAKIYPEGLDGEPVLVYCDMDTDGGGWTVFQRRIDGKTDFFRGWKDYSKGFGYLSDEFWLGNDLVHALTSQAAMSLRVDLRLGNETVYAHYTNFSIGSEQDNYAIHVSGYSGNAGDSLRYHSGRPFSTKDKDPHPLSIHCAKAYMGGWWYKNCYKANLNGLYATFTENQGVVWIDWKGKDVSIPFTEMKLRPASYAPAASQG